MAADSLQRRFWENVKKTDGCWLWTGCTTRQGHGYMWAVGRSTTAHRVSYELHVGPITQGLHVLHHCDNAPCVNPAHLFLGTHTDNMRDRLQKGRYDFRGERNSCARLTADDVLAIRRLRASGTKLQDLAVQFGVTVRNITEICAGRAWAHVQETA